MATEPDIVLADELTNHLDFQAIAVVKKSMQTYKSSFLLIDHNSEFLSLFDHFLFLPNNKSRKTLYYPNQTFDEVMTELDRLEKSQAEEKKFILKRKKALEKQLELLQFRAEVFNTDIGSAARSVKKKLDWEVESNPVLEEMDINKEVSFGKIKSQKIKKNLLLDVKNLEYKIS